MLVYTAGKLGIDDRGCLKVVFRTHSDMAPLQMDEPTAPDFLTIKTSNGAPFEAEHQLRVTVDAITTVDYKPLDEDKQPKQVSDTQEDWTEAQIATRQEATQPRATTRSRKTAIAARTFWKTTGWPRQK